MAKKLTPLQQEYKKELQRLRKGFSRYRKQGFIFPEDTYTKTPKRVTKQLLQSLKETKPKQLTTIAEKVDIDTGEIVQEQKSKSIKAVAKTEVKRAKPRAKVKTPTVSTENVFTDVPQLPPITQQETQTYYPSFDIIDAIRERIESLPDVNQSARGGVPIASRRNALVDMLDDIVSSLEDEQLAEYADYLIQNQSELFRCLDKIMYDSNDERIDASFATAGKIINYGNALSATQAETLNSMQEYV